MSEKVVNETKPPIKTQAKAKGLDRDQLAATVQTLEFAWFIGHLFTLFGVFFFTLTYLKIGTRLQYFWYNLAVFGVVESFGILVFQLVKKVGFNVGTLIKDDNVHYFTLGVFFLILRPYIIFPVLPFQLFSIFHVLSYTKSYLLPVFGQDEHSSASKSITSFVNNNNQKSVQLASGLEIVSLVFLLTRVIFFRKRSLTPFIIYGIFMKLRYEKSPITRNYFNFIGAKIDGVIDGLNNPSVKDVWIKVKGGVSKANNIILVNDWRREKVN